MDPEQGLGRIVQPISEVDSAAAHGLVPAFSDSRGCHDRKCQFAHVCDVKGSGSKDYWVSAGLWPLPIRRALMLWLWKLRRQALLCRLELTFFCPRKPDRPSGFVVKGGCYFAI